MKTKCTCPVGECAGKDFGMDRALCMMAYHQAVNMGRGVILHKKTTEEKLSLTRELKKTA